MVRSQDSGKDVLASCRAGVGLGEIDATGQGWGIAVGNNHGRSCRTAGQGLIGAKRLGGNNQIDILFNRGNAVSGAPIEIGTHQLPDPPIIAGITLKTIIGQQKLKIFTA